MTRILRIAVAIGFFIDAGVAQLCFFFQQQLGPLLDIPLKDPALTTIAGGEYVVVALVYALVFRDLERYRGLLWLLALDQAFAAALPALEIFRGSVAGTLKTIGPIPFSVLLAAIYVWGATRTPGVELNKRAE
ncbi:MAG: hypothetical protein NVS3B28_29420 [Candidatus Velthaea sp.]